MSHQPLANGHGPAMNGTAVPNANPLTSSSIPVHAYPPSPQSPVTFTQEQINALRVQIHAFKLLKSGVPIPEKLQQALNLMNGAIADVEAITGTRCAVANCRCRRQDQRGVQRTTVIYIPAAPAATSNEVGSPKKVAVFKSEEWEVALDLPAGPFLEDDVNSGIYPYNAYVHPFTHLIQPEGIAPALWVSRLQRLLVPTVMPHGLDPHQIIAERKRYIEARIKQRIREHSSMLVTMGEGGLEASHLPQLNPPTK